MMARGFSVGSGRTVLVHDPTPCLRAWSLFLADQFCLDLRGGVCGVLVLFVCCLVLFCFECCLYDPI